MARHETEDFFVLSDGKGHINLKIVRHPEHNDWYIETPHGDVSMRDALIALGDLMSERGDIAPNPIIDVKQDSEGKVRAYYFAK